MKTIFLFLFVLSACHVRAQTDSAVYYNPETPAEYPGGIKAWNKYTAKNLFNNPNNPEILSGQDIKGAVTVQFIVDSTGLVRDVTAVSGPKQLQRECVRVIKRSERWIPATHHGKKVNSWKTQDFNFK